MGDNAINELISQWRDSVREPGETDGQPRSQRRWLVVGAGVVMVLGVCAILLFGGGGGGEPEPIVVAKDAESSPIESAAPAVALPVADWFDLMQQADAVRGQSYAAADAAGLARAFDPAGMAWVQEKRRLDDLKSAGLRVSGWQTEISSVALVRQDETSALLRVEDQRSHYQLLGVAGAITEIPAAPASAWLVEVNYRDGEWLIASVEPDLTNPVVPP